METKKCVCCGLELPTTEFYASKKNKDGLQSYCKSCIKEKNKQYSNKSIVWCNELLKDFTPRKPIEELKARGYKGKLYYTHEIQL